MGKVTLVGGKVEMKKPITGVLASTLAVGSTVKLNVNGKLTEFLVVNQGIPSNSSLYDASCNGTWLLTKNIYTTRAWDSSDNDYANSDIHSYLNGAFFNLFDSKTQSAIKQVKIPYRKGTGSGTNVSGSSGLSTKVFLLSGLEIGWTTSTSSTLPAIGAKLDYFISGTGTDAKNLRTGYYNGSAYAWWTRSPRTGNAVSVFLINNISNHDIDSYSQSGCGVRPALILPSTALFDEKTLVFKGVV